VLVLENKGLFAKKELLFTLLLFIFQKITVMSEEKLYKLMGKRITELRKKAGYTSQETFAYDAEIPRALYGRYEKGANLTIHSLYRVLKYHNTTFKDFFLKDLKSSEFLIPLVV